MNSFLRRLGTITLAAALVASAFGGGVYFGSRNSLALVYTAPAVPNGEIGKPQSVDFGPFWKAWNILNAKYVPTRVSTSTSSTTVSDQDKVWGAIKGLAESYGDPYTSFFPPAEAQQFKTEISGNFEGIGMEVGMKDGIITVIAPLKDTPAYKAGIKTGDKIIKIDDTPTTGIDVDKAVSLIRGKKGTTVRLTILHESAKQPVELKIVRDIIMIPTIDTKLRDDGIYVISLYNFSQNSSPLFRKAIQDFARSGSHKLVLDLRGNPGGYLESAVDMASWFLPENKVIVKEDSNGHGNDRVYKSYGYDVFKNTGLNMVVLVDGGSASASEILAGALKEHGVARLVGEKTFGKGSVQELVPLTDDTSLKITIARWLTPNGTSISEQGLKPDVEVKRTLEDYEKGKDPQMDKAVEILLGR